jgi:hypothetical protein
MKRYVKVMYDEDNAKCRKVNGANARNGHRADFRRIVQMRPSDQEQVGMSTDLNHELK